MQNVRRFVVKKGDEARQELLEGVYFGADAVRRTLGPYGRNSVSGVRGGTPHITNDGVSILKELWIPDEIRMLGLRVAREAALKLNEICGDGTTSAMFLTYAILLGATKRLGYTIVDPANGNYVRGEAIGAPSPMEIKRAIDAEALIVIDALKAMAKPVADKEELIGAVRVATEDQALAEMIGNMQWELGPDGTILVEDSNEPNDQIERVNGIRFDNGFPTSRVINNQEKQTLELEDVHVIYTNAIVHSIADFRGMDSTSTAGVINTIIANVQKNGRPKNIVIIATKFDQLAMQEIAENMQRGIMICPINAPYVNRTEVFKDLAAVLGGTFVDVENNGRLSDMTLSDVGFATRVQASRWNAIFAGVTDEKAKNRIEQRIALIKKELKGEQSVFAQNMLNARIAQLQNGLALMKVGALTEAEQQRKRDKVDDAVASARSALQEGLVPGAGEALKAIAGKLPEDSILRKPLCAISEQIQANAGQEFAIEPWVKDPVKVLRYVVEKAASIAGNIITAEIAIDHENPKPKYFVEDPHIAATSGNDGTSE